MLEMAEPDLLALVHIKKELELGLGRCVDLFPTPASWTVS